LYQWRTIHPLVPVNTAAFWRYSGALV
jgi:hypothetical protein